MIPDWIKNAYWRFPFISDEKKSLLYYKYANKRMGVISNRVSRGNGISRDYIRQILNIPNDVDKRDYRPLSDSSYSRKKGDPKILAYYLSQFHPTPENDAWWGKGTTEWNNVGRAVPQYIGHYQPRQPGELGYYDLRVKENIVRQTELAKKYGIYGFVWYFYSFSGKSLLRTPLDMYLESPDIDFPFCLCWANESWTKAFSGSSKEVIMEQENTVESYKMFMHDAVKYLKDKRYIQINGKKLLVIYRPLDIPHKTEVISYWRKYCREFDVGELYIIGNYFMSHHPNDYASYDFDALGEFQIGSLDPYYKDIEVTAQKKVISSHFTGRIFDYKQLVEKRIYRKNFPIKKLYNALCPMWDNTPRRNNQGNFILDGATPALYKRWLVDIIRNNKQRNDLDDNLIFLNSWNEWGEGSYIEPDKKYGYAFLQATKEAIEENR